ncbi:uncharacterized protein M421DRAFT_417480 [Didymella exigua CBS 183.55]|uniref:Uncharacterized protein n=1 Tax=Didymella exigua CBS 183.55 TaxID=1150837 RepID=A0A6A5RWX8_9PLEO|nr:uncharacterized protein M421DRAFT_417480 [Didymella exigua CBS 183.55]KAF1931714.1 hypothetical protein M421DRAFT_417480 [Didymella exigua CBS 183.55]
MSTRRARMYKPAIPSTHTPPPPPLANPHHGIMESRAGILWVSSRIIAPARLSASAFDAWYENVTRARPRPVLLYA